jgi:putative endonuclease
MAGLVPAIHVFFNCTHGGRLVLFHNQSAQGILYAGVTSNLPRRAFEHSVSLLEGFTKRYGLKILVYYEHYDDIRQAIQREIGYGR